MTRTVHFESALSMQLAQLGVLQMTQTIARSLLLTRERNIARRSTLHRNTLHNNRRRNVW